MSHSFQPLHLHQLPDTIPTDQIGEKATTLCQLRQWGFRVAEAAIIPRTFFDVWSHRIFQIPAWKDYLDADLGSMDEKAAALAHAQLDLTFSPEQEEALQSALAGLPPTKSFAIRISPADPALYGVPFPGCFSTILGVRANELHDAIRHAYLSCLDGRIFKYKKTLGHDVKTIRVSIIIQHLVPSDVSGEAFSVHPESNDHDEALILSNLGLGNTVVYKWSDPDRLTINQITGEIVQTQLGKKETSYWARADGAVERIPNHATNEPSLSPEQAKEIAQTLPLLRAKLEQPLRLEWTFDGATLYLMQFEPMRASPILPDTLLTPPQEKRRLYLDLNPALLGITGPLSQAGADWLDSCLKELSQKAFGTTLPVTSPHGLTFVEQGRLYANLSHLLAIMGRQKLVDLLAKWDAASAQIIQTIPIDTYQTKTVPKEIQTIWGRLFYHHPRFYVRALDSLLFPTSAEKKYLEQHKNLLATLHAERDAPMPIANYLHQVRTRILTFLLHHTLPTVAAGRVAHSIVRNIFTGVRGDSKLRLHLRSIDRHLSNQTINELALSLHYFSHVLVHHGIDSLDALDRKLGLGQLPEPFTKTWGNFLQQLGWLSPAAFDPAQPRLAEEPHRLTPAIFYLMEQASHGVADNPQTVFRRNRDFRHKTSIVLLEHAATCTWIDTLVFRWANRIILHTLGHTGHLRQLFQRAGFLARERILETANLLDQAGAIPNPPAAFELTLETIQNYDKTRTPPTHTPLPIRYQQTHKIMDSRGRIFAHTSNSNQSRSKERIGTPIYHGSLRGIIQIMHQPNVRDFIPGRILLAPVIDEGWAPILIMASALIMEHGGEQHPGARLAIELGKPTIAGISDATNVFSNGMLVDLDGETGMVRALS